MRLIHRIFYLLGEGLRSLRAHLLLTAMTSLTIAVTLVLMGLFVSLFGHVERLSTALNDGLSIVVFLQDEISAGQLEAVRGWLEERAEISYVDYTDKPSALARFQERHPDSATLIELLGSNPLPASLEAHLDKEGMSLAAVEAIAEELAGFAGVDGVRYGREWMAGLLGLSRLIKSVGIGIGLLLLGAALFIVSNAVRLSVYSRREEISIMRIIGATDSFIRAPFYLEGAAAGIVGGVLAATALVFLQRLGSRLLAAISDNDVLVAELSSRSMVDGQLFLLVASGALLGVIGSWTSLGRFLRE